MTYRKLAAVIGMVALFMWSCGDDDPAEPTPTPPPGPDKVTLSPVKDNTLYEPAPLEASNGAGPGFYVGKTAGPYGVSDPVPRIRRGLVMFDIAGSSIPAGSTVDSVCLEIEVTKMPNSPLGEPPRHAMINLHTASASWGESMSQAGGGGGTPFPGDATWTYRSFDTQAWTTPGGDFSGASSAGVLVDGLGVFKWGSTPEMVSDVQGWFDTPGINHGWVLVGGEAATDTLTAKEFASRDNLAADKRPPKLTIYYTKP
jgi:hypothetical protein